MDPAQLEDEATLRPVTKNDVDISQKTHAAPGVLLSFLSDGVYLDLLTGPKGWIRVYVPEGKSYQLGDGSDRLSYDVLLRLQPRKSDTRETWLHRQVHRLHDRLHGITPQVRRSVERVM